MTLDPRTEHAWEWKHLTENAVVRVGQGVLHSIVVNQSDNAGFLWVIDGATFIGNVVTGFDQPKTLFYDLEYHVQLVIWIAGTWDVTVTYK